MPSYDNIPKDCKRQGEPSLDDTLYERIEIEFAIPVYLTQDQQKRLNEFVLEILENPANEPENGVHWISSLGAKPFWESDQRKSVEKWDENTLYFETSVKSV